MAFWEVLMARRGSLLVGSGASGMGPCSLGRGLLREPGLLVMIVL
jgi:hypothetical protein